MKKSFILLLSAMLLLFLFTASAFAKSSMPLYINNCDSSNNYMIVQNKILVDKTGLTNLTQTNWQWDKGNIIITNTATKDILKLKVGSSTLYKNGKAVKMGVAVYNRDGKVYIPIRAYAEAMNAKIFTINKSIYVYTVDLNLINENKSEDLSVARMATLKLQRCDVVSK